MGRVDSQEELHRLFDYNPEGFLVWRESERTDLIGQRAGWFDASTGYWCITVFFTKYQTARVIWWWHHGILPDRLIDHADNERTNDRIENLRLSNKSLNSVNAKLNVRNTSGLRGASYCKATGRWRSSIQINGHSINLGRYDTPEQAHSVWYQVACKAFGEEFVRTD